MKTHVRAAVAAIAISHFNKRKVSSIFSYSDSEYINIDVSVKGIRVNGYDYSNRCQIDGSMPNLYRYGERSHLEFKIKSAGRYAGYDYGLGGHFEVTVKGKSADVYDYKESNFFSYST